MAYKMNVISASRRADDEDDRNVCNDYEENIYFFLCWDDEKQVERGNVKWDNNKIVFMCFSLCVCVFLEIFLFI